MITQLDTLNLNKYDHEVLVWTFYHLQIVLAIMQYLSEGKKYKDSDIPTIAKFCVELIRRYPSVPELIEASFTDSLKVVGNCNEKVIETVKKSMVLLFCELCLCGAVVKENHVGKVIKALVDCAKSDIVVVLWIYH